MTDLWTIVVLLLKYHLPYFRTTIYDLIIWEDYPVSNISAQLSSGVLSRCISSRRTYDHSRFIYFCCCCCYYVYLAFSRPFTFFSVYIIFSWSTRFIITRKRGGGECYFSFLVDLSLSAGGVSRHYHCVLSFQLMVDCNEFVFFRETYSVLLHIGVSRNWILNVFFFLNFKDTLSFTFPFWRRVHWCPQVPCVTFVVIFL